jgi:thiol:disulfide interchange protein/DsbC/DsbD-like thiol-disulfide interchange protein
MGGLAALALAAFLALPAAANPVQTERVTATLESEVASVAPGGKFWVALRQQIIPKWHTYWLNPGDSGLPTEIAWKLPPDAAAGPIVWPVPKRIPVGPLVNYGYENDIRLLVPMTAPKDAKPGDMLRLEAHARWLVCEEICIPEEATLVLDVPVAAANATDEGKREGFAAARAALPLPAPFTSAVAAPASPQAITVLRIAMPADMAATVEQAYFFSERIDAVVHSGAQKIAADGNGLTLSLPTGPLPLKADEALSGILRVVEKKSAGGQTHAFAITAKPDRTLAAMPVAAAGGAASGEGVSVLEAIGLAFLGGLLLNLMPCVFPILSMKALSLVQAASGARREARTHGLLYVAGVLASFLIVAGVLLGLRAGGESIGWGFQLQSSWFVLLLAYLMFVIGLNLAGLFAFSGGRLAGMGDALTQRSGGTGAFFTGVLAVVVATPCTAPFMGVALGFALSQPTMIALAIFLALGLGMALPFLLLSIFPQALRFLPRPGPWMERFRQFLAFPMFATAAWLVWVLAQQSGPNGLALALAGMVLIGFALWLLRQLGGVRKAASRIAYAGVAAIALLTALATIAFIDSSVVAATSASNTQASGDDWQPWSVERVQEAQAQGKPVFVNFTAAWCITCLVNERTTLTSEAVRNKFAAAGVVRLKGDWTRRDKAISETLSEFGRSGVPLYVLYPADKAQKPRVLPQILTEAGVLAELDRL